MVAGIAAASLLAEAEPGGLLRSNLAGVAALLFLLVPDRILRARGEGWDRYGVPSLRGGEPPGWRTWLRGIAAGLAASALVLPVFAAGLVVALRLAGVPFRIEPRLPPGLAGAALLQLLVVAVPEELFYRGFLQSAWARQGAYRRFLGADVGPGFLATQALFAAGHLVSGQPARLLTFFPGLLFGWLRARTGSVAAPVVAHALSNLLVLVLEASLDRYR